MNPGAHSDRTLIDELLSEQRQLTAVETFARLQDGPGERAGRYRDLIPLSRPLPGQQYAFEVDLDKCSGCKACVTACHALNGLDEGEVWRDIGLLVSEDWRRPFQQTITAACHHCVDPACLNGCPVLAYEKDLQTGIVRHYDDQCIGCQYCVLKCPYDVPKYSEKRGIVRKCDLCAQRLAVSEPPACAQACPNEAIHIVLVETAEVKLKHQLASPTLAKGGEPTAPHFLDIMPMDGSNSFLPASPDPAITVPTTRYRSKNPLPPGLISRDAAVLRLQPAHGALVWMLTLTQLSAGAFALLPLTESGAHHSLAVAGALAVFIGLAGAILHLGKPLKAWRCFLGLRTSWMSREIVVFALFAALAALTAATPASRIGWPQLALEWAALVTGLAGVFCSAMIYHDTQRVFWMGIRSIGRFFATSAVLGLAAGWVSAEFHGVSSRWLPPALALALTIKLAGEHRLLRRADADCAEQNFPKRGQEQEWWLARSAVLMRHALGVITRLRFFFATFGGVMAGALAWLLDIHSAPLAVASFVCCVLTELAERYLFFRAVVPPKL